MNPPERQQAQRALPVGYNRFWYFDISHRREALLLSLWGIVILFAAWIGFLALGRAVQPQVFTAGFLFKPESISDSLIFIGELLLVTVLMVFMHEGLHGVFFWAFSKERPRFAIKIYYAYAAAPGWFFPRWQYLITALAPLVGITLVGVAALLWLPAFWAMPAFMLLVFNTSGAVGDIWVALRLLFCPRTTYTKDYGDKIEFYRPS